jgi:polysaccharide export outer membrane protein
MRALDICRMACNDVVLVSLILICNVPSMWAQDSAAATVSRPGAAQATDTRPGDPVESSVVTKAAVSELLIGKGDLIEVTVFGAPDFDRQLRVSETGEVVLPLVGAVQVAGLSTTQSGALIAKKLAAGQFFNDPQVEVLEKEYATQGVSVLGEVQKPGVYPLHGPRKLFDVLSLAGGEGPKAGKVVTITRRDDPQNPINVNLSHEPEKSMQGNVDVLPGDTVVVSKAGIVYVVGDVRLPGGFVIDNSTDMSLLKVLAMAQGPNHTAALARSRLIRKTPQGQEEMPIALDKILSAQAPDQKLQADDIVFVPNSKSKTAAIRGLEAAVQVATGLAIYGRY